MEKIFDQKVCENGQHIWYRMFVKMDKIFDKERLLKWTRYLIKNVCKNGEDIW